jgi:hypothetical protein
MTPAEFEYIKRAIEQLERPLPLGDRIKIERTVSQIFARSADKLEQDSIDNLDEVPYNSNN